MFAGLAEAQKAQGLAKYHLCFLCFFATSGV
jgi:hypothetical protein